MKIKDLLNKGYFSEELPPPFVSSNFGKEFNKVNKIISKLTKAEKNQIPNSDFVKYSIPKVGLHRRHNGIPNPYHQFILSNAICKNWNEIQQKYNSSKLSASTPELDLNGNRAIKQFSKYNEFKEKSLKASFDTFFELKSDISKYYPSLYTHSIPWSVHTKAFAKKNQGNSHFGNLIDESIRNTQNGQTNGIVIGTDTSRIIAELIGCHIDEEFLKVLDKDKIFIKGYRFVDDCHFFFYNKSDAEKALKHLQRILGDLNLNINEEKTQINQAPFQFENTWQLQLTNLSIREYPKVQRKDLTNFYNLLIDLSRKFPKDSVIKYGIKIFKRIKIKEVNWDIFESLTYSLALSEGAILPDILQILLQNKTKVDLQKLESTLKSLLNQHIYKGHHFEVVWSLWIARSFRIKISNQIAQQIIDSSDVISTLVILDLNKEKLISGRIRTTTLKLDFDNNGLLSNKWILVYEATHKKWIRSNCLETIKFFDEISKLDISFYDSTRQIEIAESNIEKQKTFLIQKPEDKEPKTEKQKLALYAQKSYLG
ncbi:RNA-directed DNA polymerase [Kaistella flava (ex Peng et al. 2021)]|uniref:RNA-directed DNA polymerase n=1 Tax=Kaistella flava (ex Peng et al. 2021) TaxID=2038776 RepID=A0A7M2YAD8_9FLAO|nr:RNA-directed DNA polymerase [Kaistella flava (ex Peng et al. 2021)]QOW11131.1 RNA-directed DNA polymerase [Kaistella flava (ex Peng et al. 2021)]